MPWGGRTERRFLGRRSRGSGWLPTSTPGRSRSRTRIRPRSSPTYRRLLWLRRRHPALQTGSYRRLSFPARDLCAFEREGEAESIVVAVNFGQRPVTFRVGTLRRWSTIFDTHDSIAAEVVRDDQLTLAARQAVILLAG